MIMSCQLYNLELVSEGLEDFAVAERRLLWLGLLRSILEIPIKLNL
jgi:hypothetical protein